MSRPLRELLARLRRKSSPAILTVVNVIFRNNPVLAALVHRLCVLGLERRAVNVARRIHSTLESITLPAEDVVAMVAIASSNREHSVSVVLIGV